MSDAVSSPPVRALLLRGVEMPDPAQVFVDESVVPERIAASAVLHPGTRLTGTLTSIGPGTVVGAEGPATLQHVQAGHGVKVRSGYLNGCVLLDGAETGGNAHIRPGTILEEQASCAHAVGMKQTVLLPFVTLGSLINFCDCLMAGGTSRKNHSEVGSSYIHFNFTPHGDKATPSLIGDVPHGVRLNQPPIFLGGQGGLVGPARVAYGVITAAGIVQRKDALQAGALYAGGETGRARAPQPYPLGKYGSMTRIIRNNLLYIGNLRALLAWYRRARIHTMRGDLFREACRIGAIEQLDAGLKERIKRLQDLAEKMPASIALWEDESAVVAQQRNFMERWPQLKARLKSELPDTVGAAARERFLSEWTMLSATSHIEAVRQLSDTAGAAATEWLQAIVDYIAGGEDGLSGERD